MIKTEAALLWAGHEKAGSFGKDNNARKKERGTRKEEDQT